MKKFLALLLVSSLAFSATACGNSTNKENKTEEVNVVEEENKTEEVNVAEEQPTKVGFKNDILKIDMATIKLTGFEVAPPNAEFGEEKSTLIITYEFTNDSDELLQPIDAWIACFEAVQETDISVDRLDVAMSPQDEKYSEMNEMSMTDIKPGATVKAVISYEINDTTKPVTLKATQGIAGKELGEKIYNLQQG